MGSFSMYIGCQIGIVSMGFYGHIKVTVLIGAAAGVVSIQTSGIIWVGRLVVVVLHNCKEHLEALPVLLFVYRAAMHVGGLASGLKGVEMWQNVAC